MRPFFTKYDILRSGASLPFTDHVRILGDAVAVGQLSAPSRLVYQPMEGCDGESDGSPGELTARRYGRFAAGGPGII
ncbi:MAG: hypothetical protein IKG80_00360 [Clostridia bacterium]|nr:hypothetical protein [Clostridia bacterium]